MKILFVCRRNNGRSQLAKGLYNHLTKSNDASSAGIEVDNPGQLLKDRAQQPTSQVKYIIQVMRDIGVDARGFERTSIEDLNLNVYDRIILLLEHEMVPDDLAALSNVEVWNIDDPQGGGLAAAQLASVQIKEKIVQMLDSQTDTI